MAAQDFNNVSAEIKIQGKSCDFSLLKLHQTMFGHHRFVVAVNYRAKSTDVWNTTADKVLEYIGESITIQIKERNGEVIDFVGVVNKIDIGGRDNNQGEVILYGGSPTVLMTDDYSMDSFEESDLASIVQETITNIGYPIEYKIEPLNNPTIPYVCRYKESSYDFLHRLLAYCGEWFFYDGKKIVVGFSKELNGKQDVALSYQDDIYEMKISSTLGNFAVEQFDYDPTADRIAQWISEPKSRGLNKFTRKAFNRSKEIHKDWTVLPSKIPTTHSTFALMENSVYAEHFQKLSNGSMLEAKTKTCRVGLGKIISVEISSKLEKDAREMGRFRVIDVQHTYDKNKAEYINTITCVNAEIDYIPSGDVVVPMAMPEVAKVVDNADPKNLGRVKVQFVWHRLEDHSNAKTSSWMRVQTPDAGSSDVVDKNRGFFFIPEIGDQVMVGYEYGDPSRPFVMGSLFHANNSQGIAENNKLKSITTRSGSTLTIDDDAHTILLCTSKANQIFIDEKNGVIAISSAEEVNVTTKNVNIDASENMTINVGKDFNMTVGGDSNVTLKGELQAMVEKNSALETRGEFEQKTQGEHTLTVAKKLNIRSDSDANIEADGQMTIASQKNMYVKSKVKVDIAKG